MSRIVTVQPPYELLVGHTHSGVSKFRLQIARTADNRYAHGILTGTITPSTATVTVADNDFSDEAILTIGDFTLRSGVEYVVGGSAAATATNIAAAISNLPGFSAVDVGSDVNISGPESLNSGECVLEAQYQGAVVNFTLSPTGGFFNPGGQTIGPIEVTT